MRCLGPAAIDLEIDALEVDQHDSDDEELRSPYVAQDELDIGGWTHDADGARNPCAVPLSLRLRRPLPGLR